ncbi:MAG: NTP transferase domain-containing protein [Firmicutes bacterium]|nr:NTP transferase domain-containing protein [Bacillota bacterium]
MKAVIMAGGEGTRLRPLTCDRPKPMVPILGRPMMEYIVKLLVKHHFSEIAVTLQYLPDSIMDFFGSGESYGVSFRYYVEEEPLGTAGSVKNASSFLDDTFLVISGDCLTDIDLTKALKFHREKKAVATIVLTPVENPLEYGVVMAEPKGRIIRFLEKPGWGEVFSDTVNTGIYILEPQVLNYIKQGVKFDFSKDLFPLLLEKGEPLYACTLSGFWCDVGSLDQYQKAQYDILDAKVKLEIPGEEKEKGVFLESNVQLDPGCHLIPPVFLGAGTRVCEGAVVGDYSIIGAHNYLGCGSVTKRSITWEGVNLAAGASLKGGILGQKVLLGEKTTVFEGAVVGDKTVLEEGCVVKPQVKIWPHKRLPSGSILRSNVVWGGMNGRSLFGFEGIKGRLNQDLSPEMAVSLGAAFGFFLGNGEKVIIGCDHDIPSQVFKNAVALGLLSTGIEVYNLGAVSSSMVRLGISVYKAKGGVYIQQLDGEPDYHSLLFFDSEGLNLSRSDERKIEQFYAREDFCRIPPDQMKKEIQVAGMEVKYRQQLLAGINTKAIKEQGFKVVLYSSRDFSQSFLLDLLGRLGCFVHLLHTPPLAQGREGWQKLIHQTIREAVKSLHAHLGVALDLESGKFFLVTEKGEEVKKEELQALLTLLHLRHHRSPSVVVPVTASRIHEELARRYRGEVIRTKTSPRHRLEAYKKTGSAILSSAFDSIRALLELLDFMAAEKRTLGKLLQEVPSSHLQEKEVSCPWDKKGKIMRQLLEESPGKQVEMIDGLKVYHPGGWALILPDPEKPSYRIYGEGYTEEIAESLTDFYLERVKQLQQEETISTTSTNNKMT